MLETNLKKKGARCFARVISTLLEPLNSDEEFRDLYEIKDTKILLNPIDGKYAALIRFKNDNVNVEGVVNKPQENLEKKKLGWDALLQTDTGTFLDIATEKISTAQIVKKVMSRKIKLKGAKILLDLIKILTYLGEKKE